MNASFPNRDNISDLNPDPCIFQNPMILIFYTEAFLLSVYTVFFFLHCISFPYKTLNPSAFLIQNLYPHYIFCHFLYYDHYLLHHPAKMSASFQNRDNNSDLNPDPCIFQNPMLLIFYTEAFLLSVYTVFFFPRFVSFL